MLACARIGAVHCVVFGGFSADSVHTSMLTSSRNSTHMPINLRLHTCLYTRRQVADRLVDCKAKVVICADATMRGAKPIPLKARISIHIEAFQKASSIYLSSIAIL